MKICSQKHQMVFEFMTDEPSEAMKVYEALCHEFFESQLSDRLYVKSARHIFNDVREP